MSTEFVLAVHQLISCVLSLEKQEPTVKAPNTSVMALKRMWEVGGGGGDTPRKGISPALDQHWLLEVALRLWSEQSCGRRLFCGKESWARIWGWPVASSGDLRSRVWWRTVRGVEGRGGGGAGHGAHSGDSGESLPSVSGIVVVTLCFRTVTLAAV